MALDIERERRKQAAIKRRSGFSWKPQAGENNIRVFMFNHKVTKQDVMDGSFSKTDVGKMVQDWDRELQVEYKGKGANQGKISYRYALNIVDLNQDGNKTIQTWIAPSSVRETIGDYVADEDYGEDILGCEGRDFKISYDKDEVPAKMYSVILRDQKHCKELDNELQTQVKDFYNPEIYEKLGGIQTQTENE